MSIVVGVKKGRDIVIAADSQSVVDSSLISPADNHRVSKIVKIGSAYLGATGWSLYENILEDFLAREKRASLTNRRSIFSFFMKLWRDLHDRYSFVNDQCDRDHDSPFGDLDASFLIVNRNGIFDVASDMNVVEFGKYYAIGSGRDFALGALHALYDGRLSAEQLAVRAAEAAVTFDARCGGEIEVRKVTARR
ncbi:MAG TPA: hypothetical protein VM492_08430 [Sumerlaeia bacterium]|nr:hypothetical protein [Sumerlaeia bacterium]